jgi:hypothetical protein
MPLVPTPRRELIAIAGTDREVNRALKSGRSVAVLRGIHVDAKYAVGLRVRLRAALAALGPDGVVGMQSSAVLHRLRWIPAEWAADDAVMHAAIHPTATHRHRDGLRLHWRTLEPIDRVVIDGIPCMSVTRTLVELARDPQLPRLLVVQILDGALFDALTTKEELLACLARFPGERGVARARKRVNESRLGVMSPQETRMRLILEDGGITGLDVDIQLRDDDNGDLLARGELGIKRFLIWGEYDGYARHSERETFRNDRPRQRWISRRGWNVMPFVDRDLSRPTILCQEWLTAIADAPARIASLDPRRSPEIAAAWRALGLAS